MTNSKWLGLKHSDKWIFAPRLVVQSELWPKVILYVPPAGMSFPVGIGEFAKNLTRAFAHDVGENIQPPAVSHAQNDFFDSFFARFLNGQVQQWNQAFRTVKRKGLSSGKFSSDKFFEGHRIGQARQDPQLLLSR